MDKYTFHDLNRTGFAQYKFKETFGQAIDLYEEKSRAKQKLLSGDDTHKITAMWKSKRKTKERNGK